MKEVNIENWSNTLDLIKYHSFRIIDQHSGFMQLVDRNQFTPFNEVFDNLHGALDDYLEIKFF